MAKQELNYTVSYRNVKHARLEFKTGALLVVLPKSTENSQQTLEKYRSWISRKKQIINNALLEAQNKNLDTTRSESQLKQLAIKIAQDAQNALCVTVNNVYFRKMRTKWASNSKNNNLTINTLLKYLPDGLIEYVVYHEVAHGLERKHNVYFWNLIAKQYRDFEKNEKDLLTYWFIVQRHLSL